jgi:hypothetical protein
MFARSLVIVLIVVLTVNGEKCTDTSGCFIKKIFDFNYPKEGLYSISISTKEITKIAMFPIMTMSFALMAISTAI